jgi:hypothetical protein
MGSEHSTSLIPQWQLDLIRDAISGLVFQIPREDVMFVPFLDCVSLLHQQRVVYALWKKARNGSFTCRRVFMQDPTYLARFTIGQETVRDVGPRHRLTKYVDSATRNSQGGIERSIVSLPTPCGLPEEYGISLHTLDTPQIFLDDRNSVMPIAEKATEQVRQLLRPTDGSPLLSDSLLGALHRTAAKHALPIRLPSKANAFEKSELSWETIDRLLAPMKQALNSILKDIGTKDGSLRIKKNGLPNIFAVVRLHSSPELRYKGQFDYTCRFLVLEKLRKWLQDQERGPGISPDLVIPFLETPLRPNKRSVADHVFANETVTFRLDPSGEGLSAVDPDQHVLDENWPKKVQRLESRMYPRGASIMYVPIHVCLTPWITLYTLNDPAESGSSDSTQWHHNYLFYRQLVHGIADQIRTSAASAYLEMFANCILYGMRDVYGNAVAVIQSANRRLQELAQVYPFPMGRLEEYRSGPGALSVGNLGTLCLSLLDNPFFGTSINNSGLALVQVLSYCQDEVHAFLEREQRVASRGIADATHFLKYKLDRLLGFVSDGNKAEAVAIASNLLLLHDVAAARLNVAKRDILKREKKSSRSVPQFCGLVEQEYFKVLGFLRQLTYSGNIAKKIVHVEQVLTAVSVVSLMPSDRQVTYYDFLIAVFIEGLVSNAVLYMNSDRPAFQITIQEEGSQVLMSVSNSIYPDSPINESLLRLNHPGSDGIGVAQLHWLTEAFWTPHRPPSWTLRNVKGVDNMIATIQVGEIL